MGMRRQDGLDTPPLHSRDTYLVLNRIDTGAAPSGVLKGTVCGLSAGAAAAAAA